jgi:hypothetical protein
MIKVELLCTFAADGDDLVATLLADITSGFPGRVLPLTDLDPASNDTNVLMPDEELFQYILRKSALESRQQAAATASRKMSAAPRNLISDLDINHVDSYSLSNHGNHEYSSDDYQQDEQAMTSRSRSGVGVYSSRDSGRYSTTANNDEDSSSSVPSYRAKYQRSTSEGSTVMATRLGMLGLPSPTQPAETSYRSQTSSTYSSSLMSSGRDLDPGSDTVRGPWGRRREALASQQAAEGKMTSSMSGRTEVKPRRRIARGQTEGDAVLSIRTPEQTTEAAERAREWLVAEQNGSLPAQGGRDSSIFFRSRRRALSSDLGQAHPAGTTQLTLFDTGDNNFSIDSKYTTARDLPAPVRDYTPRYTRYSSTSDYAADLASRFPLAHGNRSAAGDGDGASRNGQYDLDRDQAMLENQQVTGDTGVEMLQENTEDVDHDQVHVHSYTDTTASSTSVLDSVSTPTSHTSNIPSSPLPAEKDKEMPARVVPDAEVMPSGVVEETGSDALLSRSNSYRQKIAPRAARQRVSSRSAPDGDNSTPGTPALTPGVASAQVSSVTSTTDSKSPSHTNSPRQTNGTGASYSNGNDVTSPRTAAAKQADESQKELSPTTSTALPENKTVSQSSRATARTDRVDTTTDRQPPASSRQKGTTTTTTTTERRAATNDDSEQRAARLARSTRLQPADMLLTGTNTVPAPILHGRKPPLDLHLRQRS